MISFLRRYFFRLLFLVVLFLGPLQTGSAQAASRPSLSRSITPADVITRAEQWVEQKVPYSQNRYKDGYRTDCSGFVSMAYQLSESATTKGLLEPRFKFHKITKEELQPGDILLKQAVPAFKDASGKVHKRKHGHVVIFGGWTSADHSRYTGLEEVGGRIHRAVKRELTYPYSKKRPLELYVPMRYERFATASPTPRGITPTATRNPDVIECLPGDLHNVCVGDFKAYDAVRQFATCVAYGSWDMAYAKTTQAYRQANSLQAMKDQLGKRFTANGSSLSYVAQDTLSPKYWDKGNRWTVEFTTNASGSTPGTIVPVDVIYGADNGISEIITDGTQDKQYV